MIQLQHGDCLELMKGVACVNLNRNFIGMELKQEYFDIANERINDARFNKQAGGD